MLSIQRILFPTDLSEDAAAAFPHAVFLADWYDADLHVLNVTGRFRHEYGEQKTRFPLSPDALTTMLGDPDTWSGGRIPDLDAIPIVQNQVEAANPAQRIVQYTDENRIDLVVMSTHGRTGLDRLLSGSVAEEVVRTAPSPVFAIRADAQRSPNRAVRRILCPVDFSDAADHALAHAKALALTYGAELNLLHVVEEVIYPSTYGVEPLSIPTGEVLARVEEALGQMVQEDVGYEHVMVEATAGYAPTEILDFADERDVDLIVLATHGRTGMDRLLMGSVAERVVRGASRPVFVVKAFGRSLLTEAPAAGHPAAT